MRIYTYCSYKGSPSGYQFALFDLDSAEEQVLSLPAREPSALLPEAVREWFLNRSGWKMALCKSGRSDGGGYLLLRSLEDARELLKKAEQDRVEEIRAANAFRRSGAQEPEAARRPDQLESDFFLSAALEGPLGELRHLAAGLLDAFQTDGGLALLSGFEEALSKRITQKEHSYAVSPEKLRGLVRKYRLPPEPPAPPQNQGRVRLPARLSRLRRSVRPQMVLPPAGGQVGSRWERREQLRVLTGTLLRTERFSEELLLYVSDGSSPDAYGTANLTVSMEYLLSVLSGSVLK